MKTVRCAAVCLLLAACAGESDDRSLPDKDDFRQGKADGDLPTCEENGFPPDCDLCAELGWYGDGSCDDDLVAAGVCKMPDEADCTPTAYRIVDAKLADPHAYVRLGICADVTSFLNDQVSKRVKQDGDGDGMLDLSLLNVFRPFDPAAATARVEVSPGSCAAPAPGHACAADAEARVVTAAQQLAAGGGDCLAAIPGTAGSGVNTASAPCYATDAVDLPLSLAGVDLDLEAARVGGRFAAGDVIDNGLASGFVSEEQANAILLPADLPLVGGKPLSSVLPGGAGSCQQSDGRDTGPDGVTRGWYFYLDFTAQRVDLTSP
jgi:hypothetical protein